MQNGMSSFKADLQRKIQNYQSILKKTYEQQTSERKEKVQARNKSTERNERGVINRTEESVGRKQKTNAGVDSITSMKQHYMSKIQTLNQQLESNKAQH